LADHRAIVKLVLNEEVLNVIFRALADPTRRAIVERLGSGPASVSELSAPFDMSLPAVMQHLQVLEECGLVTSHKLGRIRTCALAPGSLRRAERWLAERRTAWEVALDRLGERLEERTRPD
jgi:DNA-binding transcriptional ArsR family regulator